MVNVYNQIVVLYLFLLVGCFFGKKKKALTEQTSILSYLVVNFLLPAKVFRTFSTNCTVSYFKTNYKILLTSVGFLIFLHIFSKVAARFLHKDSYLRRVYEYSFTISNYAYLGYTLMEGVFGETGLANLMIFCIPFSIYTYTVGYIKLTGDGKSLKRAVNPMTGAILLGLVFGLSEIPLPTFIHTAFSSAGACVGPIAMLLTGLTLSTFSVKEVLRDKMAYVVVLFRLVVIPAMVFGICSLLHLDAVLPSVLFMAAMPTGLNTIVFPKSVGEDPRPGARLAMMSHAFSVITIPFWVMLIS
jgi:predicted permease